VAWVPCRHPQGDVKGEGGLDDATGTNKFGGGASMKQTSSSVDLTRIKEEDDEEKVGAEPLNCLFRQQHEPRLYHETLHKAEH
jgi:hypothetical protein